jgi:hypothetical protein
MILWSVQANLVVVVVVGDGGDGDGKEEGGDADQTAGHEQRQQ